MIMMHLLLRTLLVLLLVAGLTMAQAQEAKPCPPRFSENGAASSSCVDDVVPSASGSSDSESGPVQISGGLCPDVPTRAADHVVNTESEFITALADLDGVGGIIEIEDGSYSWGNVTVNASGADENNRIYIRSETLYGATFGTGHRWNMGGAFVTVSGFTRVHSTGIGFYIENDNIRIACHDVTGQSPSGNFIEVPSADTVFHDDFELDNNRFDSWNAVGSGSDLSNIWRVYNCGAQSAACLRMHQRHHIHHNHFEADVPTDQALYFGEGWYPEDANNPWVNPKSESNFLIENNTFDWPNFDPSNVKRGKSIWRFNCFLSGTRVPHTRHGHDTLWYGNWFRNPPSTQGFDAGWGVYRVFNYTNSGGRPIAKIRIGQEGNDGPARWGYSSSSFGVFSNNVCDGCPEFVDQITSYSLDRYSRVRMRAPLKMLPSKTT